MIKKFPVKDQKTTFGMHLMLDAYGANEADLADMKKVFRFLVELPDRIGMHRLTSPIVIDADATDSGFDPGGITGFVLIAESHISIHTFAAKGFFTMDLYSCSNFEDQLDTILEYIKSQFPYSTHELQIVKRGTNYPMKE